MSAAVRASIAGYALCLAACDSVLGLKAIVPDGDPVKLTFAGVVARGVVQQSLGRITVSAEDIQGKPVQSFTGEIKLTLGDNPGGANLMGEVTATAVAGKAYFDPIGIDRPAMGYTLTATTDGLPPATTGRIDIVTPPLTPVSTGLHGAPMTSIAVSPAPAGGTATVFAGAGNGVYRSSDGGASWQPANFGASGSAQLVADPKHPGVVYLALPDHSGLRKTVDGGATWRDPYIGDFNRFSYTTSYDVDPTNPSVIYAVAAGSGVNHSTDGGASWGELSPSSSCYYGIAVDRTTSSNLYCISRDLQTQQRNGVYRSTDSGATWQPANAGLTALDASLLVATPNAIFVGADNTLFRSTDAGASWTPSSVTYPSALAYAPSMPKRIYVAWSNGVSVSNDAGASFGSAVLLNDYIVGLAVDPTSPDVVYAAGNSLGVFVSTNGGVSWSPSSMGIDAPRVTSVAMAPGVPSTVLTSAGGAVLRTTNSGTTWTTIAQAAGTIGFDPSVSTRVYLCSFNYFSTSTNSGASFSGGGTSGLGGCGRLVVAGSTLFAAGSGLFKSSNSGATWAAANTPALGYIFDVALGDAVGSVVVVSAATGLYRSTDGGTTFTRLTSTFGGSIVTDPRAPTHVIYGQCDGVRVSTDGGATFGTASGPCVQALSATGSALYAAGTDANGTRVLLRSSDGGSSWAPIEIAGGIPRSTDITSISASDDGQTIYIGTSAGLYKNAGR